MPARRRQRTLAKRPPTMRPMSPDGEMWDRWVGEPAVWYDRLWRYLQQPSGKRSVAAVYREEYQSRHPGATKNVRPGENWIDHVKVWKWRERADAYDDAERRRQREADEILRKTARQRRLDQLDKVEAIAAGAIAAKPKAILARELRADQALDLIIKVQQERRKEWEPAGGRGDRDDAAAGALGQVKAKVYIIEPGQPDPRDEL